ncbi:MAG: hypothetical protein JXR70_06075 [Spirochaetales bacterium]|nr:hypothetical protein [Spirochaetales bacterium]
MKKYAISFLPLFFSLSAFSLGQAEVTDFDDSLIMVINYPYQIWSQDSTKIHTTFFMPDFKPAKGAEVFVDGRFIGRSDGNGVMIFDLVAGNNSAHLLKARLNANGKVYGVDKSFSSNARTESFRVERVFVYTDRGVYNPGQEILLRVLAWELTGEYRPLVESPVEVYLQNRDNRIFCGEKLVTDAFGVAHSRIPVPRHLPEGDYELVVLHGEARESAELRIEPFRAPAIRVSHDAKRYLTSSQKQWGFHLDLSYFTGGSLKSGSLDLIIKGLSGDVLFRKSVSFKEPAFDVVLSAGELVSVKSALSEESAFKLVFDVSDSFGQRSELVWDMQYTAKAFRTVLEIDKDSYLEGEQVQVLARIVDLDGQPVVNLPVVLQIDEIQFRKTFQSNAFGIALLTFTMPGQPVNVVVTNPDTGPVLAQRYIPFQAFKPLVSKVDEVPEHSKASVLINALIHEDYMPVEKVVHVDLTDVSGALVQSTTIALSQDKGRWIAGGRISPPTWGSMLVNLYVCAVPLSKAKEPLSVFNVGFMTEGQHVTFYPDKEITLKLSPLKDVYEPGEDVSVKVRLENAGNQAIVGVSLVDEAVLNLKNPLIKKPYGHFYNPQVKVLSTGGSGVLTWPVVDRNWGSPWRDIAYTNWGWKGPGALIDSGSAINEAGAGDGAPMSIESEETMDDSMEMMAPMEAKKSMAKEDEPAPAPMVKGDFENNQLSGEVVNDGRQTIQEDNNSRVESQIVIRSEFPETSYWDPVWMVKNGQGELQFTLPQEMTTQQLTFVASDQSGALGVLEQGFLVSKGAFIRSAFPAEIALGDRLWAPALVRNQGEKALSLKALLVTQGLEIHSEPEMAFELQPGESRQLKWLISANTLGEKSYSLRILGKGFNDQEDRTLLVAPAGLPVVEDFGGDLSKSLVFSHKLQPKNDSIYRSVTLSVGMPNMIPAIQAWDYYINYPWYSPWAASSAAIMNQALLKLAMTTGKSELVERIHFELQRSLGQLLSTQHSDGSWGWYNDSQGEGNVYLTLNCLRALGKIDEAGLLVSGTSLQQGIDYLFSKRNAQGLWDSKTAYFWDSYNRAIDYTLSAEIFEVITELAVSVDSLDVSQNQIDAVKNTLHSKLSEAFEEPLFHVAMAQGLINYEKLFSQHPHLGLVSQSIQELIKLKRGSYWEPHWYHAYGGMVELNSRVLLLLAENNKDHVYDSFIRESLAWLLSSREAWGAWHNELGTARAIEALAASGLIATEKPSRISVFVDGRAVVQKKIDPSDPFLSAASLRFIDLSSLVKADSTITVEYKGELQAYCKLEVKDWGPVVKIADVEVKRVFDSELALSRRGKVLIQVNSQKTLGQLLIHEKIPSLLQLDLENLDNLVKMKKITAYEIQGRSLWISIASSQMDYEVEYQVTAIYQGQGEFQAATVSDMSTGLLLGLSGRNKLEVN